MFETTIHGRMRSALGVAAAPALVLISLTIAAAQDTPPSTDPLDPRLDQIRLDALREDGTERELGSPDCVSIGEDGTVIPGWNASEQRLQPLPVGDGRRLVCSTFFTGAERRASFISTFSLGNWCLLGQLAGYHTTGDERLVITLDRTDSGRFELTGRSKGGAFEVVAGTFNGGTTWPLFVRAQYDTVVLEPQVAGLTCEQQFGL